MRNGKKYFLTLIILMFRNNQIQFFIQILKFNWKKIIKNGELIKFKIMMNGNIYF